MERKNSTDMNKKYAIYAIIAITSFFLIRSGYQLFVIEDMLSKQKSDIFSGLVTLAIQPKITDIKMNILIEVIIIALCVLFLNWNKIKK